LLATPISVYSQKCKRYSAGSSGFVLETAHVRDVCAPKARYAMEGPMLSLHINVYVIFRRYPGQGGKPAQLLLQRSKFTSAGCEGLQWPVLERRLKAACAGAAAATRRGSAAFEPRRLSCAGSELRHLRTSARISYRIAGGGL
jgi:hypothetical protein